MRKSWTSEDIDILADNSDKDSKWLSEKLDRSEVSVISKRSKLKLGQVATCVVCGSHLTQVDKYCVKCNIYGRKVSHAKYRMNTVGMDFTVSDEEFIEMAMSNCAYCGQHGGGVDRIDSAVGYTSGNCVPCCRTCNTMKMDLEVKDWLAKIRLILENYND